MCKKNKNQQVVVAKAATKYSLNVSKTEMYVGNSFKLKLKGVKGKVKWTSEDDGINKAKEVLKDYEKNNEGWYFYYKNASDDGKDNRGVKIGSTKEEFLSAYI